MRKAPLLAGRAADAKAGIYPCKEVGSVLYDNLHSCMHTQDTWGIASTRVGRIGRKRVCESCA